MTDTAKLRALHAASTPPLWFVKPTAMRGQSLLVRGDEFFASTQLPTNDSEFIAAAHNAMPGLLDELEAAYRAIEADRTRLADGITAIDKALDCRFWLTEGRGSYAWDDDRYRQEFKDAAIEILAAIKGLRSLAADLSNSPKIAAEIVKARLNLEDELKAARQRIAELEGQEPVQLTEEAKAYIDELKAKEALNALD